MGLPISPAELVERLRDLAPGSWEWGTTRDRLAADDPEARCCPSHGNMSFCRVLLAQYRPFARCHDYIEKSCRGVGSAIPVARTKRLGSNRPERAACDSLARVTTHSSARLRSSCASTDWSGVVRRVRTGPSGRFTKGEGIWNPPGPAGVDVRSEIREIVTSGAPGSHLNRPGCAPMAPGRAAFPACAGKRSRCTPVSASPTTQSSSAATPRASPRPCLSRSRVRSSSMRRSGRICSISPARSARRLGSVAGGRGSRCVLAWTSLNHPAQPTATTPSAVARDHVSRPKGWSTPAT